MSVERGCDCCESESIAGSETPDITCYCPIDGVLDTVGKRYSMQIIALLGANGPTRYGELEEALAVTSSSTLAERLEELRTADLIERRSFDEVPPRVEYSLTHRGRGLEERLRPLLEWVSQPDRESR